MKSDACSRCASASQRTGEIGWGGYAAQGPVEGLHRRARPGCGQFERGLHAGEALAPVGHLGLEPFAGEALRLPVGVVGVLDLRLRQRAGAAGDKGLVAGGDLAHQDAHGPAVGDDVVHRDHEDMVALGEPEQRQPKQRPGCQVEWFAGFLPDPLNRLGLPLIRRADAADRPTADRCPAAAR